ncbi:MAG: lytic transglycosylase domain-containing protein [Rhodospirillales bacterium]|nr:lytic transglycosylase domain-containing protein [Rhodospirillales bacterium]
MAVPYLACMTLVAATLHLPPRVLPSIQRVEGGTVGRISRNANGTADLGVMQVNTVWLRPLARISRLPEAEVERRLVADACFNISAAGLILRLHLAERRGDLMRAIGDYHSATPALNARYQARVLQAARALFAR